MDRWARWLLEDRHGGDEKAFERTLASLLPIRDRVLDRAALVGDETVLDVGTGDGLIGFGALDRLGDEARVIFSDVSTDLLDTCRRIAVEADVVDRCRFVETEAEGLHAIEDRSIDVVTARSVLIYVADKSAAFAAFHRVLRPGGRLSIFEPLNATMRQLNEDVLFGYDATTIPELAAKVRKVYDRAHPPDSPMMNFDAADLAKMAATAGFNEVGMKIDIHLRREAWLGPTTWETLRRIRPNPNAMTFGEAMDEALTPDEQHTVRRQLQPQVETGEGRWFNAWCYLTARLGEPTAS